MGYLVSYKMYWILFWWFKVLIGNFFCLFSFDFLENEVIFVVILGGIVDVKEWCFVMNINKWIFGLIYYLIVIIEGFCW